jgi:hypothetical protein
MWGNKINENICCLGELMCKHTINLPVLEVKGQVKSTKRNPVGFNFELADFTNNYASTVNIICSLKYDV